MKPLLTSRRQFLATTCLAAASPHLTRFAAAADEKKLPFRISLAQWTINREIRSGEIDNLDFARVAHDHGIHAVEYVNQFFMDKAKDESYLGEMKKRAEDLGVTGLLIMCDNEGDLGDPDTAKRNLCVEKHRKWIDAAKFLGCHSIRVNAASSGTWDEQLQRATDGLAKLTEYGAEQDIFVIVENHYGLSCNPDWLVKVIKAVDNPSCGTLPDFGNFRVKKGESFDSYQGVKQLMPWAKGVSVKDRIWDDKGNELPIDFDRMFRVVLDAGFHGYCGIEFGGYKNLNHSREILERSRDRLSS